MAKVLIQHASTQWPPIDKSIRKAAKLTLSEQRKGKKCEVSILLTDDNHIRQLNRHFRQQDKATNVLSFALQEGEASGVKENKRLLGDVVLAYQTIEQEATEAPISFLEHTMHLVVHGLLHLLGYDHERSEKEAERQEKKEIAILAQLGIANPYALRETV
ncbi:rRNA maturation RNase YbeY [Candidatus Magnetaquicoccus inordinatus]|uniref:rRNA maturation RNase YbeY n=1 Tax=Candidatus Magnetaquicoccus inordinatus TaxID=2496818 RepID=UPI00102BF227|nr:rRNA maturation RNase YbeY [Candidatus Magnetaquicoccus inordinatus]